jgi:hypothetical protein
MPKAKTADGPFKDAQELFLAPYAEAFRTHMLANPGPKDALEATAKKWKNTNCPDIHSKMNQLHPYPSLWSGKTSDPDVSKVRGFSCVCHSKRKLTAPSVLTPLLWKCSAWPAPSYWGIAGYAPSYQQCSFHRVASTDSA